MQAEFASTAKFASSIVSTFRQGWNQDDLEGLHGGRLEIMLINLVLCLGVISAGRAQDELSPLYSPFRGDTDRLLQRGNFRKNGETWLLQYSCQILGCMIDYITGVMTC